MRIHPFLAALRLWGRRLALATEPSPVAALLQPFPRYRGLRVAQTERAIRSPALDGEALAALRAACVDDLAATSGLHTDAEAVGALATGNGRLVSTFHVALTRQRINRASIAESAMAGGSRNGFRGTRYLNWFSLGRQ
jgi:hypothetical protein